MKTSFSSTVIKFPEAKLTPKELVQRHMFDLTHTISEEEWKQLQVGIVESENLQKRKRTSRVDSFINSYGIKDL